MVALTPQMRQALARAAPKASPDALPAHYSRLGASRRIAVREEYCRIQDNDCYYCGCSLDGPPSVDVSMLEIEWRRFPDDFLKHSVHLHHCHKTDLTIGAVHALCNAALWQYEGE